MLFFSFQGFFDINIQVVPGRKRFKPKENNSQCAAETSQIHKMGYDRIDTRRGLFILSFQEELNVIFKRFPSLQTQTFTSTFNKVLSYHMSLSSNKFSSIHPSQR